MSLRFFGALAVLLAAAVAAQSFDYFVLEVQWGGGFCAAQDCTRCPSDLSEWTLHGMWPSAFDGNDPSYCNNNWPFNLANISSIESTLDKNWISYDPSTDNQDFWSHEWDRHGTCAASDPSYYGELAFFQAALKARYMAGMYKVLSDANIVPSSSYYYSSSDIISAVQSAYGHKPLLDCSDGRNNGYSGKVIVSIGVCLDKNLAFTDCSSSNYERANCQSEDRVYYAVPPS